MEEEWRIFLKENAPELYEAMLSSVMWQAKWRDEKISTIQAEVDKLKEENKRILNAAISERTPVHRSK